MATARAASLGVNPKPNLTGTPSQRSKTALSVASGGAFSNLV
ncbi:hypothetical protein M2175_003816 [Bradyrhizobium elkanii]|nr:hypothetical protein [Bradyrhizobium elkanii]MCS3969339.1 hypothetical protein [Bradyrhizobium japonicum]